MIIYRYVVCIAKGMKPHLVLNDEEKQQRFDKDGGHRGRLVGDVLVIMVVLLVMLVTLLVMLFVMFLVMWVMICRPGILLQTSGQS